MADEAVPVRLRPGVPFYGAIAQLGERLFCTQEVSGSIPLGSIESKDSKDCPLKIEYLYQIPYVSNYI